MAAKKNYDVVGGYKIPGARGGAAVRRACEIIVAEPGIAQSDLLKRVTGFANINLSTAGWITSPAANSPAGILWERRKVGRSFHCYPNEYTPTVTGSTNAMVEVWKGYPCHHNWKTFETLTKGSVIETGDPDYPVVTYHGWMHDKTSNIYNTLEEAANSLHGLLDSDGGLPPWPALSSDGIFMSWVFTHSARPHKVIIPG